MNRKALVAIGVAAGCSVFGFAALGGGATVKNVPIANVRSSTGPMEVYGALDKRSIRAIRSSNLVAFDIIDDKTKERLSVLYVNPSTGLQVNFPTASHVRASAPRRAPPRRATSPSTKPVEPARSTALETCRAATRLGRTR